MLKKNLKKGFVKKIEREEFVVVILGPLNKTTGICMEKKVALHCVAPVEDLENEAFEFIREKIVGKEIEFNDYDLGEKMAADIFVDGKNLAHLLVSQGLGRYFQAGQKTSIYYDDLVQADQDARVQKKGQYAETDIENKDKKKKKKTKKPTLESVLGTEVTGWIEEVNFKLDFQVYIREIDEIIQASFAGVSIPVIGKEHMATFRNFCGKNVLQRLRKFKLKQLADVSGTTALFLVELGLTDQDSVLKGLFTKGFARLDKEASSKLELVEMLCLKSLQDEGMIHGKGIWKDYKGKMPMTEKKADTNPDLAKLLASPEFEAVVVAVHSGDTFTVETPKQQPYRISFSNLKAKSMGNPVKGEDSQPWAFEAKEALRKKIIGKTVRVKLDNIRNVVTEERTFDVITGTLYLDNQPVALELIEKGLLGLVPPRLTDPASAAIVVYSEAAKKAETLKKGIHSDQKPLRRFWDLSRPENRKKAKTEFSLESHKDVCAGVVENVISATRFKIRFDQENCYFILSLNSIKGVPNNVNNKTEEKWANEALELSKKMASQRDVKFQIEQVDKNGVAHGNIVIGKENMSVTLLKKGLVFVEKSFRYSKYLDEYQAYQDAAKESKKGIWGDNELNLAKLANEEETIQGETKTVVLSEFFSANDFFLQENNSENFSKIEKTIKKGSSGFSALKEPILAGTIALGQFEGDLNRCKILHKRKEEYEVEFIDYGNSGWLKASDLKQCPNELQKIPAQAFNARLDFVLTPPSKSLYIKQTNRFFEKLGVNAKLKCRITRKNDGMSYCLLWVGNAEEELGKSVNYTLVKEGLAILDANIDEGNLKIWEEAGQIGGEKNPDLISFMNNIDE